MLFIWDDNKCRKNLEVHGYHFRDAVHFEWESAVTVLDNRKNYGEDRLIATGYFNRRLTVLVYVHKFDHLRIISWRRANIREMRIYENLQRSEEN